MAELTAVLRGEDQGLESALDSISEASSKVNSALDRLDETLSDISQSMEVSEQASESLSEAEDDVRNSTAQASAALEQLSDETQGVALSAETANIFVGRLGDEMQGTAINAESLESALDNVSDEASEASRTNLLLAEINDKLSSSNLKTAATSRQAASGIDEMGDEASETTGELIGTASAAELLSLQSSALSINVGAFTVALRNLTTQVPLLVASLGNLSAAFAGLGGAIGAAGIGGASVAFGGLLAKAEEAGANLNDFESVMTALEPTSQALQESLIEAFRPVIEAEGVIRLIDSLIQGLVDTVHSFSVVLAEVFEGSFGETAGGGQLQSLDTTFSQIGESFQQNIDAINRAIGDLIVRLGDDLAGIADSILSGLPGFIRGVTVATEEIISIIDVAGDSFGRFISDVSNLGRTIGAGLAPVLDSFFDVLADVAEGINSIGEGTLATAVKVGALILAINRLGGIMGSIATPIAQATANLASFALNAESFVQGFMRTVTAAAGVSANASTGINKLSSAFELLIPPLNKDVSTLERLNDRLQNSDRSAGRLSGTFSRLSSSVRSIVPSFTLTDDVMEKVSNSMFRASQRLSHLSRAMRNTDGVGDIFSSIRDKISSFTSSTVRSARRAVPSLQSIKNVATGSLIKALSPIELLARKMSVLGGAMIEAGDKARLFGGIVRASLTGTVSGNLLSELQENSRAIISEMTTLTDRVPDNVIRMQDIVDGNKSAVRSLINTIYIDPAVSRIRSGASRIRTSFSDALSPITRRVSSIGDSISTSFISSIANSLTSPFSSLRKSANKLDDAVGQKLTNLAEGPVNKARDGFMRLGRAFNPNSSLDSFGEIRDDIRSVGVSALKSVPGVKALEAALSDIRQEQQRTGSTLANLGSRLVISGGKTAQLGKSLKFLRAAMAGNITITSALRKSIVALSGAEAGASLSKMAYAAATSIATSAATAFLAVTGVLVGALAVLVAIVGTVAAALVALGQSGQDAESMVAGLMETLRKIGAKLMPAVRESAEMMLDIFNSIAAPVKALVSGFKEVGVALGLIDESAGSGGLMAMLEGAVSTLNPILESIGFLARLIGGVLTQAIETGTSMFVSFIESANIAGLIDSLMGLVGPLISLFTSIGSAVMGTIDAIISVFGALFDIVTGYFGTINDALGAFMSGLTGSEDSGGSMIGTLVNGLSAVIDVVGVVISGVSTIIDTFVQIAAVVGPIIGFLFDGIMSIASIVGGLLIDGFRAAGQVIRGILGTIADVFNSVFGGVIDDVMGFVDSMVSMAQTVADAFVAIPQLLMQAWNNNVAGELKIPEITLGSNIEQIPEMTLGGQSITIPEIGGSGGSSESGAPSVVQAAEVEEGDVSAGAGKVPGLAKNASETLGGIFGGRSNVNVEEGDTTNIFNQTISAEPEDEAQMGRIAKDAMQEAEAFKRRQEGSQ